MAEKNPSDQPSGSFDERLAWLESRPNFRRIWIYCFVMAVLLGIAAAICLITGFAHTKPLVSLLGFLWLGVCWFFSTIAWRTRHSL